MLDGRRALGADRARSRCSDVEHQGIGASAVTHRAASATTRPEAVVVLPRGRVMPALPMPARLRGLTGQHDSRRPGQGGGLRDVHPFSPGDAVRQVDWKVTARRSPALEQLYVRRTMALGEAAVVLVVDSRDDVGPDPATWSGIHPIRPDDATSLDLARQAAMTVAEGYLAVGDRVAVEDLGVRRRALRAGTGRHQLDRVVQQLALLRPEGDPPTRVRPPRMPVRAASSTCSRPSWTPRRRTWRARGGGPGRASSPSTCSRRCGRAASTPGTGSRCAWSSSSGTTGSPSSGGPGCRCSAGRTDRARRRSSSCATRRSHRRPGGAG